MKRIEIPNLKESLEKKRQANKRVPTPLHEFVLKARKELGEKSKEGDGSFGFYLGILKTIPTTKLYQMLGSAKETKDPLKNFWWQVGQYKKDSREAKAPFKRGDKVRITKGPSNKKGKVGTVSMILSNGAMVQLSENLFTPVQFKHLEMYD